MARLRALWWLGGLLCLHAGLPTPGHGTGAPRAVVPPPGAGQGTHAMWGSGVAWPAWILPAPGLPHAAPRDRAGAARLPAGRVARLGGLRLRAAQDGGEGAPEAGEDKLTVVEALREWDKSRRLSHNTLSEAPGSKRKQASVLFVSNRCVRAILAEKLMTRLLETRQARPDGPEGRAEQGFAAGVGGRAPLDRLLVLSAGLDNLPGAPIGRSVMAACAEQGIDLTEDNPCARFHETDLDMFDLIVCMDVEVRERVLELAMQHANAAQGAIESALIAAGIGGFQSRYPEYEKKIVLVGGAHSGLIDGSDEGPKNPLGEWGVPYLAVGAKGTDETQACYQQMKEVLPHVQSAVEWSLQLLLTMGL